MGRPRSLGIDYDRLADLQAREFGARRIARELGCSVSTAKRLLRGQRPETDADAVLLRDARARAALNSSLRSVGSDPTGAGRVRKPRFTPRCRAGAADGGPVSTIDDWSVAMAKEALEPAWNRECEADFLVVVSRLAASLRRHPSQNVDAARRKYQFRLAAVASERTSWRAAAIYDLERRWRGELRALTGQFDVARGTSTYWADVDAREQFERIETLLARRLATLPTGSSYYDIVDVLVAEGARRHEPTLRRLVGEARTARAAAEGYS